MFITFEGLDGSGSSTQAALLKDALEKRGKKAVITKEPTTDEPLGILIRQVLQGKKSLTPQALQLLFTADRAEHLHKIIEPALAEKKVVISDRYTLSTLAFGALSCPLDWLNALNKIFPKPDLTFLLHLDPAHCVQRIAKRGNATELFEQQKTLEKVWQNYENLAQGNDSIQRIEANRPIEEVHAEIVSLCFRALDLNP